jgi:hypothetical protein
MIAVVGAVELVLGVEESAEAMAAAQAALGRIGLRMVGASTRPVEGGILLEAEVQGTLRPGR